MDQPVEPAAPEVLLLRLEHVLILEKGRARALEKEPRCVRIVEAEIPREAEVIVAGGLGLGRHQMGRPERDALAAISLRRPGAGRGAADVDIDGAGRLPGRELPAVDIALEAPGGGKQRRRLEVDHPASDLDAAIEALGPGRRRRLPRIARNGAAMQVADMGKVEQIVDQQLRIGLDAKIARRRRPARIGEPGKLDDLGLVRARGVAHPDPDDIPSLRDRVGPHPRAGRDGRLAGNCDAPPLGVEGEAVIAAAKVVALDLATRQGRCAVAAAILERRRPSARAAEQHNRLAEQGAPDWRARQIPRPDRGIPAVSREHHLMSSATYPPRPRPCPKGNAFEMRSSRKTERLSELPGAYKLTGRGFYLDIGRRADAPVFFRPSSGPCSCNEGNAMKLVRRQLMVLAGAAVCAPAVSSLASAQTYPSRPVRVIVPYAAGGPNDVVTRIITQKLSESWGSQFYVDNIPAGASTIGTGMAARAPADGYTIVVITNSFIINPSMFAKVSYDPIKDFAPVTLLAASPLVLVVHPSMPANSVKELVALLKANPGKYSYE